MSNEQAQHPPAGGSLAERPVAGLALPARDHQWSEPWEAVDSTLSLPDHMTYLVRNVRGAYVIDRFGMTAKEERNRIIACVNALVGVPDPVAELTRLRRRDALAGELVEALEKYHKHIRPSDYTTGCGICALLARVREEMLS